MLPGAGLPATGWRVDAVLVGVGNIVAVAVGMFAADGVDGVDGVVDGVPAVGVSVGTVVSSGNGAFAGIQDAAVLRSGATVCVGVGVAVGMNLVIRTGVPLW